MANLPEDILKLVFKSFAEDELYRYKFWAKQLVLLSVCQRWRQYALPLVCHVAEFNFKRPGKGDEDLESMEDSLETNFDKVMAIGHPSLVRHLDIRINHDKNTFACIILVLNKLTSHLPVWTSLRSICITVPSSRLDTGSTVEEIAAIARASRTIADKMAKMMPNIVKLEFQDFSNNTCKIMYERLANLYSPNLKILISNYPIPLNDINVFNRLTNLHTACGNNISNILPLAHIDSLECLNLKNIPKFMQRYNVAQNQGNKLVFSNLREVRLSYERVIFSSTLSANTVETPEFHFPKLQSLTIFNTNEHQQLLSGIVLKSELDILYITASISSLKLLTQTKLPSIKRLKLITYIINDTHSESLTSVFDVLCKVAKCAQIIDDMHFISNSAHIDLTGCNVYPPLTNLYIRNITDYEQVFSLLQRLPHLKQLRLQSVNTDDINLDELEALLGNQDGVAPISPSVKKVSVSYNESFSSNSAIMFTTLLLVGMPALRKFYASRVDHYVLLAIINKHKARYQHLENVLILNE